MLSASEANMRVDRRSRSLRLMGAILGSFILAAACTDTRPILGEEKSDPGDSTVTVPGSPTGIVAAAGSAEATVRWLRSASDGGSAILAYTVTSAPSGFTTTVGGDTLQATVEDLVNGTTYIFTVTATNKAGTSAPSAASNAVVPRTVPGAPASVAASAGNATATVAWARLLTRRESSTRSAASPGAPAGPALHARTRRGPRSADRSRWCAGCRRPAGRRSGWGRGSERRTRSMSTPPRFADGEPF